MTLTTGEPRTAGEKMGAKPEAGLLSRETSAAIGSRIVPMPVEIGAAGAIG
jgi:hypothetical protein